MATLVRTTPVQSKPAAKGNAQAAKPTTPTQPKPVAKVGPTVTQPTAHKVISQVAGQALKPSAQPIAGANKPPQGRTHTPGSGQAVESGKSLQAPVAQPGTVVSEPPKPKKPRIGLDEDEVKAAIEGRLEPREVKGTHDQSALTETDEHGRAKGRPVGISTGLPILGAWAYVFQENEKNADNEKLTDEQITIWMTEEFPGRDTPAFKRPAGVRDYYNRGGCTKGILPKIQSVRYNADGTIFIKPPRANPFQKKTEPTAGAPAEGQAAEALAQTQEGEQTEQFKQIEEGHIEGQEQQEQTQEQQEVVEEQPAPAPASKVPAKPMQKKK